MEQMTDDDEWCDDYNDDDEAIILQMMMSSFQHQPDTVIWKVLHVGLVS